MSDEPQTGPRVLALGTLAVGAAAVAAAVARRRNEGADSEDGGRNRE